MPAGDERELAAGVFGAFQWILTPARVGPTVRASQEFEDLVEPRLHQMGACALLQIEIAYPDTLKRDAYRLPALKGTCVVFVLESAASSGVHRLT